MYVGNHHASTFLSLGQHSLCDTKPIYNRSLLTFAAISYKLVYDKQGVLCRSYRVETSNCDLSALLLCNI